MLLRQLICWAVASVRYGEGVINWAIENLERLYRRTRQLLITHGGFHSRPNVNHTEKLLKAAEELEFAKRLIKVLVKERKKTNKGSGRKRSYTGNSSMRQNNIQERKING